MSGAPNSVTQTEQELLGPAAFTFLPQVVDRYIVQIDNKRQNIADISESNE